MGKARLLENLGNGLYRAMLLKDRAPIDAEIAVIDLRTPDLSTAIATKESERLSAAGAIAAKNAEIGSVLANPALTSQQKAEQVTKLLAEARDLTVTLKGIEAALSRLRSQVRALEDRKLLLNAVEVEEERTVWASHYATEVEPGAGTLEVATLEIPGDTATVVLRPAVDERLQDFAPGTDGNLTPALGMSPAACFAAMAMQPGWQRFKPTFRAAIVLAKNSDGTLSIGLIPPNTSRYGSLDVTPLSIDGEAPSYARVPVAYMDCNAEAFRVGDRVIVSYDAQDPMQPRVIGFLDHPQPCGTRDVYNALGDRLRLNKQGDKWAWSKVTGAFGTAHWVGDKRAVSWSGYTGRYPRKSGDSTGTGIFSQGVNLGPAPAHVLGAAIAGDFLVCVTFGGGGGVHRCYAKRLTAPEPTWVEIASYPVSNSGAGNVKDTDQQWFFSPSGLKAVSVRDCVPINISSPGDAISTFQERRVAHLSLTITGEEITGSFTVESPVSDVYVSLGTNASTDTCAIPPLGFDPADCDKYQETNYILKKPKLYADFVGEDMVYIDYEEEIHTLSNSAYGSRFTGCSAGTGPTSTIDITAESSKKVTLSAPALDWSMVVENSAQSSTVDEDSYGVPSSDPVFFCRTYTRTARTEMSSNTSTIISYLNIAGGAGKVAMLARDVTVTRSLSSLFIRPRSGSPVPGGGDINEAHILAQGEAVYHLKSGDERAELGVVPIVYTFDRLNSSATETGEEFWALANLNGVSNREDFAVSDISGHICGSCLRSGKSEAIPSLPQSALGGNLDTFTSWGVG